MSHVELLFLEALKAALANRSVDWTQEITEDEWNKLFRMASDHNILPMIYEAVFRSEAFKSCPPVLAMQCKRITMRIVTTQAMKSMEFLTFYQQLKDGGVTPCVVKGIVCRSLYPNPDYRVSSDEDVFIPAEQFEACHKLMLSLDMELSMPEQKIYEDYEVPYNGIGSQLYIELHKHMFSPDEVAYGHFNEYFDGVHERLIPITVDGGVVESMPHSDHMFYLICHAFKHFLHGGFGLRQVCDILLYGQKYTNEIDWNDLYEKCGQIAARKFAAAMIRIGDQYLGISMESLKLPEIWIKEAAIDETMMLKDLLDAGIYGNSEAARKQSSNITVAALAAERQGKRAKSGLSASLFPPVVTLKGRYPYLENHHWLLPVAWISRIADFAVKRLLKNGDAGQDSAEILKIGNERVELMRMYGIIK